jgi:hypothetical protein
MFLLDVLTKTGFGNLTHVPSFGPLLRPVLPLSCLNARPFLCKLVMPCFFIFLRALIVIHTAMEITQLYAIAADTSAGVEPTSFSVMLHHGQRFRVGFR